MRKRVRSGAEHTERTASGLTDESDLAGSRGHNASACYPSAFALRAKADESLVQLYFSLLPEPGRATAVEGVDFGGGHHGLGRG